MNQLHYEAAAALCTCGFKAPIICLAASIPFLSDSHIVNSSQNHIFYLFAEVYHCIVFSDRASVTTWWICFKYLQNGDCNGILLRWCSHEQKIFFSDVAFLQLHIFRSCFRYFFLTDNLWLTCRLKYIIKHLHITLCNVHICKEDVFMDKRQSTYLK